MRIRVNTNAGEVSRAMRRLFDEQAPFAMQLGLNAVTLESQEVQRVHQRRVFDVRRPAFVDRAVRIRRGDFATKRKLRTVIRIEPPGGQSRADILTKFEEDTRKEPAGSRLAIPAPGVRRTKAGVISRTVRPRNLEFRAHGGRVFSTRSNVMVGARRTVMIRKPGGRGAIFQRVGRGASSELRLLYVFRPIARIEPELNFTTNVRRTVEDEWPRAMDRAWTRAIRGAR